VKRLFFLPLLSFALIILILSGVSNAAHLTTTVGDVAGGIVDSRHNLSSSGWPFRTFETSEICVFCHTPHHGRSDTAPLWNKNIDSSGLTAYGMTIAKSDLTSAPTSGSSLACLSCHDGTSTFDTIINAPGKGTYNGSVWTSAITGTAVDVDWTFTMFIPATYGGPGWWAPFPWTTPIDHFNSPTCDGCHEAGGIINFPQGGGKDSNLTIGPSLANDHPIGVSYIGADTAPGLITGARASLRSTTTLISSIDLDTDVSGVPLIEAIGGAGPNYWAVNGFIKSNATIEDLLKTDGKVECSSCHDPHFKNQTNPEIDATYTVRGLDGGDGVTTESHGGIAIDGLFLRRVGGNSDSGVCRTCHAK
jgi:hypothetical protein